MSEITILIEPLQVGDKNAAAQPSPLIYDDLRRLAARRRAHFYTQKGRSP
jgi:hypothetical protein